MDKRQFLSLAVLGLGTLPVRGANGKPSSLQRGPPLLTISGAIARSNRSRRDHFDQLMARQKIEFDLAYTFDFAALAEMSPAAIRPTLQYDGQPHNLSGPPLIDVLKNVGASADDATRLWLRAVDGFVADVSMAQVRRLGFIIATQLDGKPMALGGMGPLWAVFEPDRFPELRARPLPERFTQCPWGLYHIEVRRS